MNAIKMNLGYERSCMDLPRLFVDHYMTDCIPVYPLIYIWSLSRLLDGESTSIQEIGERFLLTEGDVLNAWKHWEKKGLIELDGTNITFLPVKEPKTPTRTRIPAFESIVNEATTPEIIEPVTIENWAAEDGTTEDETTGSEISKGRTVGKSAEVIRIPTPNRPQYTAQELACYRTQSRDIERLFARAEKTLGKLLSYNDMNVIFGFYDWLRLPIDVIEYLLSYCADNDHRNMRYIEKCALDWADNNIDDLEKALTYVQSFDLSYRTVLKYMGQKSGYPSPSHRKFIDRWLHEWNMPLELIQEACDRSVENIDKPKFSYVDKILAGWNKKGITTIEGVKAADDDFNKATAEKSKPTPSRPAASKPKTNRFMNFNQRDTDYSQFEKLERAYLAQQLKVSE